MITKKILGLIALAIMTVIVSVACGEKPTDAGNVASSTEIAPIVAEPEQSVTNAKTLNTDLPTWDAKQSFDFSQISTPKPTKTKADLVGTWSGQYVTFWIDAEGNLNFNNVDMEGKLGYNATYAGYNGKIAESFEYPYSIELTFTPPASWGLDPKSEKGTFTFNSPTSGYFTGYAVQKLGSYPYGWTRISDKEGSVTKTSVSPY